MAEPDELFRQIQMKRAIYESALAGELTHHLGYAKGAPKLESQTSHRNRTTPKAVLTEDGAIHSVVRRELRHISLQRVD